MFHTTLDLECSSYSMMSNAVICGSNAYRHGVGGGGCGGLYIQL